MNQTTTLTTLQSTATRYTTVERASAIYNGVLDIFDYNASNDVTTPVILARHQVRQIPSRSGNVLIPGAGIGTYILALLQEGFKPEQITAVELDPAYSRLGYGIFNRLGVNYVTADFLSWESNMKFNVIIGNPPYQNGKNSDFYVQFFKKSFDLLEDGGYLSLLSPTKGCLPSSKAQQHLKKLGWYKLSLGLEKWFPQQQQTIAIYEARKGYKPTALTVTCGDVTAEYPFDTVFPVNEANPVVISTVDKFFKHPVKLPLQRLKQPPVVNYLYVSRMVRRFSPNRPKGGPLAFQIFTNSHQTSLDGGFLECASEDNIKYTKMLTESPLYRFVYGHVFRAAFVPPLFWSLTPDLGIDNGFEDMVKNLNLSQQESQYVLDWSNNN